MWVCLKWIYSTLLHVSLSTGMFVSLNGLDSDKVSTHAIRTPFYYMSDILLNKQPWLDERTACLYPALGVSSLGDELGEDEWIQHELPKLQPTHILAFINLTIPLSRFEGTYQSSYTTDIIVQTDPENKKRLVFEMGKMSGILHPTGKSYQFMMEVTQPFEYAIQFISNGFIYKIPCEFTRSKKKKVTGLIITESVDVEFVKSGYGEGTTTPFEQVMES